MNSEVSPLLLTKVHKDSGSRIYKRLEVRGGLLYDRIRPLPYFTLTCVDYREGHPEIEYVRGPDHELILRLAPQFKDMAKLHLADMRGTPYDCERAGWYFIAGALGGMGESNHAGQLKITEKQNGQTVVRPIRASECLKLFAEHIRVPINRALFLIENLSALPKDFTNEELRRNTLKARWAKLIDQLRPEWLQEAESCILRHGLVTYGEKWPPELLPDC